MDPFSKFVLNAVVTVLQSASTDPDLEQLRTLIDQVVRTPSDGDGSNGNSNSPPRSSSYAQGSNEPCMSSASTEPNLEQLRALIDHVARAGNGNSPPRSLLNGLSNKHTTV